MHQCLSHDKSLVDALARINADRIAAGLEPTSLNSASFSDARKRLPEELPHQLCIEVGQQLEEKAKASAPEQATFKGRPVKVVDGSTLLMPDSKENQAEYPQLRSQREGSGFPIARIVVIFSLFTGAVLNAAFGAFKGKGTGEHALLRQILDTLQAGEIVLADAYYSSYFLMALLMNRGTDFVFATHGARHIDYRTGKSIGRHDHVIEILRPQKPDWMSVEEYDKFPRKIVIREFRITINRPGFRARTISITTSMLDAATESKDEIGALYFCRWSAELNLRDIKTTMAMDMLRCKTPAMITKEIWVFLLSYNAIRKIMLDAALKHGILPWQISFKASTQVLNHYSTLHRNSTIEPAKIYEAILDAIATKRVGTRPGRSEPRKRKRRPKPFPVLKGRRKSYSTNMPTARVALESLRERSSMQMKENTMSLS